MDLDKDIVPWLLRVHAAAGGIALFVAPLAMLVRKGGDWHRRWGRTFFWGMVVVCSTAIALGIIHPNNFWLALVAVFSFHMVASGYRSLYLKRLHAGQKPERVDFLLHGIAGLMNAGLLIWGLAHLFLGRGGAGPILFVAFGSIGMFMVVRNVMRFYRRKNDKREWLYGHMIGFLGGYIATVSAFSAVNLTMIRPVWLQWLWPTIIGTPLIIFWVRYYRKKFASGQRMRNLADIRIR
jgi:fluoride ion exporter CrcB/FEX